MSDLTYMDNINVFVFCGGKCGGATLTNTFNNNDFVATHLHGNNCNGLSKQNRIFLDVIKPFDLIKKKC